MKRVLCVVCVIVVLVTFTACQKTPESPIVIGKDHEQMIEQAASGEETDMSASQQVGAAERYTLDAPLTNARGNLEVYVDAQVIAPATAEVTTARVGKHAFTTEECEQYVTALFDGQTTYSGDVFHTKDQAQRDILELQRQLAKATDEQARQRLQGHIEKLQISLDYLPEGEGMVEAPVEFYEEANGSRTVYLISDGSDGLFRSFKVDVNQEWNTYDMVFAAAKNGYPQVANIWSATTAGGLTHGTAEYGDPAALPDPQMSREQAVATAEQMLADMGVDGFVCKAADVVFGSVNGAVQKAHELYFTRVIDDMPFNYSSGDKTDPGSGALVDDGKGGYIQVWEAESMTFLVTDAVARFEWMNPYDVLQVVTEHTAMLDFGSVMEVFEKMIIVTNADVPEGLTRRISVERVELGLMRVLDPTSLNTGVVIPVWDFYGKELGTDAEGEFVHDDPNAPYLTINAVDGSVIDRQAGY